MSVADSTNRSHQGKKKQALRNAIRSADFRKMRTRPPLTPAEIDKAIAADKEQRVSKQRIKGTICSEHSRQRKKRILVANILHKRTKEQQAEKEPRPDQTIKTVSFKGRRAA